MQWAKDQNYPIYSSGDWVIGAVGQRRSERWRISHANVRVAVNAFPTLKAAQAWVERDEQLGLMPTTPSRYVSADGYWTIQKSGALWRVQHPWVNGKFQASFGSLDDAKDWVAGEGERRRREYEIESERKRYEAETGFRLPL